MTNYGWQNEAGEPIMDGAAYRFEQVLDAQSAEERYLDDDEFFASDEPTCDDVDTDDVDEHGRPWCYGCDGYADHGTEPRDRWVEAAEDAHLDGMWEE